MTPEELDLAVWPIFYKMSDRGLHVSMDRLTSLQMEVSALAEEQLALVEALAGRPINPSSGDQVAAWMKENGLWGKYTEGGRLATDERSLAQHHHPVLDGVLAYRGYRKLEGTFIAPIIEIAHRCGGVVRVKWRLTKVRSGRVATEDPNLLAFPSRTELGRRVRSCFVARPGYKMLSVDYSQLEPRIVAALSGGSKLLRVYAENRDLYSEIATELEIPRQAAKVLTLGILYGMSGGRLQGQLMMEGLVYELEVCEGLIRRWFDTYPTVKTLVEETCTRARQNGGWVTTVGGRGRFLPGLFLTGGGWPCGKLREEAERQCFNHLIQGTGMECLKEAMLRVDEADLPDIHPLLAIHDELVYEVPEDSVFAELAVREKMHTVFHGVELAVKSQTAEDWGGLK